MYVLSDFRTISSNGFNVILPQTTVDLINELSKHVGAPSYIKTPVFYKKDLSQVNADKKPKRKLKTDTTGWTSLDKSITQNPTESSNIVFTLPTKDKKHVSINEQCIQSIRAILNKAGGSGGSGGSGSKSTVEPVVKICAVIDDLMETDVSTEDILSVTEKLTDILSSNVFYSAIYSKIYTQLVGTYDFFKTTFYSRDEAYVVSYDTILDVDPIKDYDLFCDNNKENDLRRSRTTFYTHLYSSDVIPFSVIVQFMRTILQRLHDQLDNKERVANNDQLVENISIFLNNKTDIAHRCRGIPIVETFDDVSSLSESMTVYLAKLAKAKPKERDGLSTKSLFKLKETMENLKM